MEKEDILKIPLKEQENLKELFRLLEKNGMEQEKKQVFQMADYIDSMETKMEDVLSELKSMREQLSGIENQSFRTKAEKIVAAVEGKLGEAKEALGNLKRAFLGKVEQALQAGKTKGKEALSGILKTIRLPQMTLRVQHLLKGAVRTADQGIMKLGDMADELHAARQHLGNAGRTLTGRKMRKAVSRDPERGAVYEVQRLMFQSMVSMERMERRTENLLERMDRLSAKEERGRTSVRESIRELRSDQPTVQDNPQKQRSETVRG